MIVRVLQSPHSKSQHYFQLRACFCVGFHILETRGLRHLLLPTLRIMMMMSYNATGATATLLSYTNCLVTLHKNLVGVITFLRGGTRSKSKKDLCRDDACRCSGSEWELNKWRELGRDSRGEDLLLRLILSYGWPRWVKESRCWSTNSRLKCLLFCCSVDVDVDDVEFWGKFLRDLRSDLRWFCSLIFTLLGWVSPIRMTKEGHSDLMFSCCGFFFEAHKFHPIQHCDLGSQKSTSLPKFHWGEFLIGVLSCHCRISFRLRKLNRDDEEGHCDLVFSCCGFYLNLNRN